MVISQKNLEKLADIGFEVTYRTDDFMSLFNEKYSFGVDLYHSDSRDDFQGIYMSITDVDGVELKQCKGRNVISNVERWIENVVLK